MDLYWHLLSHVKPVLQRTKSREQHSSHSEEYRLGAVDKIRLERFNICLEMDPSPGLSLR